MKKKTKKKWRWLLALLVAGAFVSVWMLPHRVPTPKMNWRVPVASVRSELPSLPALPDLSAMKPLDQAGELLDEIKDQALAFEEKMMPETVEPKEPPPSPPAVVDLTGKPSGGEGRVAAPPVPDSGALAPPISPAAGAPRIALVIDDMGLVPGLSRRAIKLPAHVTLSYLPYAPHIQEQVDEAKAAGHDILLHLPMEPMGHANPGPNALRTGQSVEEWQKIIMNNISAFEGFIGVNNHMGSRFSLDSNGLGVVSEAMREEGLFYIDSRTNPRSIGESVMRAGGVKTAARDVFLDDTQTAQAVRAELARLEQIARRKGAALAIGHPHAVTLQALEEWIPDARARGFVFVPARTLVR